MGLNWIYVLCYIADIQLIDICGDLGRGKCNYCGEQINYIVRYALGIYHYIIYHIQYYSNYRYFKLYQTINDYKSVLYSGH